MTESYLTLKDLLNIVHREMAMAQTALQEVTTGDNWRSSVALDRHLANASAAATQIKEISLGHKPPQQG